MHPCRKKREAVDTEAWEGENIRQRMEEKMGGEVEGKLQVDGPNFKEAYAAKVQRLTMWHPIYYTDKMWTIPVLWLLQLLLTFHLISETTWVCVCVSSRSVSLEEADYLEKQWALNIFQPRAKTYSAPRQLILEYCSCHVESKEKQVHDSMKKGQENKLEEWLSWLTMNSKLRE